MLHQLFMMKDHLEISSLIKDKKLVLKSDILMMFGKLLWGVIKL